MEVVLPFSVDLSDMRHGASFHRRGAFYVPAPAPQPRPIARLTRDNGHSGVELYLVLKLCTLSLVLGTQGRYMVGDLLHDFHLSWLRKDPTLSSVVVDFLRSTTFVPSAGVHAP